MLVKHTSYNLIGLGVPLIAAVVAIPILVDVLGTERFGLLTLIWAVVSYFGLFDLGLGRAMTQQLAVLLADEEHERVGPLVATATILMAGLGVLAGIILAAIAPWGVGLVHGVPDRQEAINAVYAMALVLPAIVLTSGFRGILVARHAFGIINLIRLPMGLFTFLGPLVVVLYGQPRLDLIAVVLAAGRVLAVFIHAWYAWRELPLEHGPFVVKSSLFRPLYTSGGWMTVSNVISPFMGYVDRFLIGAIVSASAVAYYATPYELVTKLWIVPGALTAVLFPTFAAQIAKRDEQSWKLFRKSVHGLFAILLPVTASLMLFSHEILSWWINPEFASKSAFLLQIFSIGILFSCIAHVPFALIQSAGHPKMTAIIHLIELPAFLGVLWWLTSSYGAVGAAFAWLLRMLGDTALMFIVSSRLLDQNAGSLLNTKVLSMAILAGAFYAGAIFEPVIVRIIWFVGVLGIAAVTVVPPIVWVRLQRAL